MEYELPVMERHAPFLFYIHYSQVYNLFSGGIISKLDFRFGVLPDISSKVFNGVDCIYDLADL